MDILQNLQIFGMFVMKTVVHSFFIGRIIENMIRSTVKHRTTIESSLM